MLRERELSEIDKLLILNEKLKQENEEVRGENKQLNERITKMTKVMVEYDIEAIEQETDDNVNLLPN